MVKVPKSAIFIEWIVFVVGGILSIIFAIYMIESYSSEEIETNLLKLTTRDELKMDKT